MCVCVCSTFNPNSFIKYIQKKELNESRNYRCRLCFYRVFVPVGLAVFFSSFVPFCVVRSNSLTFDLWHAQPFDVMGQESLES